MPKHRGFVVSTRENGKADVIIRPGTPGIPNAPEVSERVCHAPTDGSTVTVEAWNRIRAQMGDWVVVSQSPRTLRKNAATLLGIPGLGLVLGIAAGALAHQRLGLHPTGAVIIGAAILVLANFIAAVNYRRLSAGNLPVITRIIKTREELATSS